ncbi:MAG: hypothetical protein M3139_05495 [Bacteroidota bacterium]|nr:hypothetical protein [Bacteroidota bacterium]
MKSFLILFLLVCGIEKSVAQDDNTYYEADRIALSIPVSQTNSTANIAAFINTHFNTDTKKVRAIYTWVTSNIKYDADSVHRVILLEDKEQLVTSALKRKRGVCENFASIFSDICNKAGLPSFVVEGYTKQNSSVDKSTHAWCTTRSDNKWFLYDPTWDIGFAFSNNSTGNKTNYFQISPSEFIQSHMPFDPMFQLLNYPESFQAFNNGNIGNDNHTPYFNFDDSLNHYKDLDPLNKYMAIVSRIKNNGAANAKVNTKLTQLKLEMEIIYQDADSVLYNGAIADYNKAVNELNNFLNYRNNHFTPIKTTGEVQALFSGVNQKIFTARAKLVKVNQSKANLNLDTGDITFALDKLAERVKEQQAFLKSSQDTAKEKNITGTND